MVMHGYFVVINVTILYPTILFVHSYLERQNVKEEMDNKLIGYIYYREWKNCDSSAHKLQTNTFKFKIVDLI